MRQDREGPEERWSAVSTTLDLDPGGMVAGGARVALRTAGCLKLVDPRQVRWVTVEGDRCVVAVRAERWLVREPLARLAPRLGATNLLQIQRAALVNLAFVEEVRRTRNGDYEFVFADGTLLRSGPTYREAMRRLLQSL